MVGVFAYYSRLLQSCPHFYPSLYLPYITETTPPTDGYPSLWTAFAAIEADQCVQLLSGTLSVVVPSSWIHVSRFYVSLPTLTSSRGFTLPHVLASHHLGAPAGSPSTTLVLGWSSCLALSNQQACVRPCCFIGRSRPLGTGFLKGSRCYSLICSFHH